MKRNSIWCWKCSKDEQGSGGAYGHEVQLIGGYNTRLCRPCRNRFHEYIDAHPKFAELNLNLASFAVAVHAKDEVLAQKYADADLQLHKELYAIAKAWVPEPVESKSEAKS